MRPGIPRPGPAMPPKIAAQFTSVELPSAQKQCQPRRPSRQNITKPPALPVVERTRRPSPALQDDAKSYR